MDELIKKFDINIGRIRKANQYFRHNEGNRKTELTLDVIINECNDICNELILAGYDITTLNMEIT
jgi:hypothetical protein